MRISSVSLSSNEYHTTAPQNAVMVNSRISPFHAGANHYSKEGDNCREDPKLFTEEAADENGWLAVIQGQQQEANMFVACRKVFTE